MKGDHSYQLTHGPYRYALTATYDYSSLALSLSEVVLVDSWAALFQSVYIEEVTGKTGQKIPFSRFCEQLHQVLTAPSEHNYAEVLSSMDI